MYRARRSRGGPSDADRSFALKAFHVDLTPEQAIVFGDALQAIVDVGVQHAAVVSPAAAGVADGVPYLAYEYVAAESLDVRMRARAPFAVEVALPILVRLAEGLDAAHGRGLVHGALHLRDVLLAPDGARVGGFGVAAALGRVGRRGPLRRPYSAPEQVAGGAGGAPADRYAFAAVAYELLAGRRAAPADDGRMAGRLEQALDAETASRLMPLFEAALAAEPERRPSAAGRFAGDLAGAVGWAGGGAPGAPAAAAGGGAEESGGGGAAADAIGGNAMRRRKKRTPWSRKPAEVDWTARALELDPPEETSGAGADDPQAAGAAGGGVEDVPDPPGAGFDALDAGGAGDLRDEAGRGVELPSSADTLADVAEGLDAGLRDGRGGAPPESGAGLDPGAEPRAADGYTPISLGDLASRVEGGGAPAADPGEAGEFPDAHARDDPRGGEPEPGELDAGGVEADGDGAVEPGGPEFVLDADPDPDGDYDYPLEDDPAPEEPAGDLFGGGEGGRPERQFPLALAAVIGVAVVVAAFVVGLGWMGGDEAAAPAADEASETAAPAGDAGRQPGEEAAGASPRDSGLAETAAEPPPADSVAGGSPAPDTARGSAPRPARVAEQPVRPPSPVPSPESPAPAPAPEPPAPSNGRLLVRSMPPGAEVIVNGQPRGTTPFALSSLPYGPYEVEVTLAGYGSRSTQVVLDAEDPIGRFDVELTAMPAEPSADRAAPVAPPPIAEVGLGSPVAGARRPGAAAGVDSRPAAETPMLIPDAPAAFPNGFGAAHRASPAAAPDAPAPFFPNGFRGAAHRASPAAAGVAVTPPARVAASIDGAAR